MFLVSSINLSKTSLILNETKADSAGPVLSYRLATVSEKKNKILKKYLENIKLIYWYWNNL